MARNESALLEVEGLSVTFPSEEGDVHAVRDVSFTVDSGEVLGVVGESGSGKSVSLMAVPRLLPGSARVTGSDPVRRRRAGRGERGHVAGPAGCGDRGDLPGPDELDEPGAHRRPADRRGAAGPRRGVEGRGLGGRGRRARPGRHPPARGAREAVPARVLRWHAPARDDRHGDGQQAPPHHRRRAHDGPGRHRAGPGARGARPGPGRVGRLDGAGQPRPRRRRRHRRPGAGDVRRDDRGDRADGGGLRPPADALHRRAAVLAPGARPDRRAPAPDPRGAAVAGRAAARMLVRPAVPDRRGRLPRRGARAGDRHGRRRRGRRARHPLPALGDPRRRSHRRPVRPPRAGRRGPSDMEVPA